MKLDLAGWLIASAASIASSAAGAVASGGDERASLAMMGIGGVCAIVGALYYRVETDEPIALDAIASVAMAFIVGAAAGDVAGALLDAQLFAATGLLMSKTAEPMIGGVVLGGVMAPLTRALLAGKIGEIWSAVTKRGKQ